MPSLVFAQPTLKWTSPYVAVRTHGFFQVQDSPSQYRYFTADPGARVITVMNGPYSATPAASFSYETIESWGTEYPLIMAYSKDVTGDGMYDMVLQRAVANSRTGYRIVDIATGNTVATFDPDVNATVESFDIQDLDGDGLNEIIVGEMPFTDIPRRMTYKVYATQGTATSIGVGGSESLPNQIGLEQNYPNPFNPETNIRYVLPSAGAVSVTIFDANGRTVRELASGVQEAGAHEVLWDGTDASGVKVSSGAYFYQLKSDRGMMSKKMLLLK
jgi:hypothetical protein